MMKNHIYYIAIVIATTFQINAQEKSEIETDTLKEVVVTAETSKKSFSSTVIHESAITHLQASSLQDILQLVPGNLSNNPSLSSANVISFRDVNKRLGFPDETSSLGTSIFVDGIEPGF